MELNKNQLAWFYSEDVRPYVFVRKENRVNKPGSYHGIAWFTQEPLEFDPLRMKSLAFANEILNLESKAFASSAMPMARWVFYDCAIMPGFVAGYAMKRKAMPPEVLKALSPLGDLEWLPISLFIIIPSMNPGEWVAHNLCSVNSLVPKSLAFPALGFLSKAFALWYANIVIQCGMTQWTSPALKLHCHYGKFEVLTAYTPVHSYSHTLTYRAIVEPKFWINFFKKNLDEKQYASDLVDSGLRVDPKSEKSLIEFQTRIEKNEGPFYLNAAEILNRPLGSELSIFRESSKESQ